VIAFEKYHGLGNDYLVVDEVAGRGLDEPAVRRICDRSLGVGSDGILLRVGGEGAPFGLRILNPDGSEAEKSGNGLRIFARYLYDRGEVGDEEFAVRTPGGDVRCRVLDGGRAVRVEMGRVTFHVTQEPIEVAGRSLRYSAVSIGNPHCVVFVDDPSEALARELGPLLERDSRFPNRTNVQLVEVVDRHAIRIEIWERGAGHTLASGSSSCAAAAVAHRLGYVDARVEVRMPGGSLAVEIGPDFDVVQQGPVVHVASGTLDPEAFEAQARA